MTAGYIALADGTVWQGRPFGSPGRTTGEVVFNTSLTGYQEILTDPSYRRQIIVMTAPHIGNTGVNEEDAESSAIWASGLVCRAPSRVASSWRSTGTLDDYLSHAQVPGLGGVDTRALVRHIRSHGAMPGAVVSDGGSADDAIALARSAPDINALDLVAEVTCRSPYDWTEAAAQHWYPLHPGRPASGLHVVVYDFGVKRNTLRLLAARGCQVTVVPAGTPAGTALAIGADGILLSNGPGDPATLGHLVATVRELLGKVPIFGICLGHQLLGTALGGTTYKLKFGHRGGNQPVMGPDGRVAISSHNHGFALARDGLPAGTEVTHTNLNDGCVEGIAAPGHSAFSVQYHPEAGPGPHDAIDLFDKFTAAMLEARAASGENGRLEAEWAGV